jgi:hypothetical protein
MKLEFRPDELRHGLGIAKLVKPITNDFTLKIINGKLFIHMINVGVHVRKFSR